MSNRAQHHMPADVRKALRDGGMEHEYRARPYYQRSDYLGWILSAKLDATRQSRIRQMVSELQAGDAFTGDCESSSIHIPGAHRHATSQGGAAQANPPDTSPS